MPDVTRLNHAQPPPGLRDQFIHFMVERQHFGSFAPVPLTITAAATTSTNVRVTFSLPVVDNPALSCAGSYEFDPPLVVSAVTPENVEAPTYVDCTVSEMLDEGAFSITLHQLEIYEAP